MIGIAIAILLISFIGVYFILFSKVSYEVVTTLPTDRPIDLRRDRETPVTFGFGEEYIGVLPPYGYKVEFIDVVREGGIIMRYNLIKLEDPYGEAPAFVIKVSNPRGKPMGAFCQNLDILD